MKLTPVTAHLHDVSLAPLTEADRKEMQPAAADPALFRYWPRDMAADKWDQNFDLLKKYIKYAKTKIQPRLSALAAEKLQHTYVSDRQSAL